MHKVIILFSMLVIALAAVRITSNHNINNYWKGAPNIVWRVDIPVKPGDGFDACDPKFKEQVAAIDQRLPIKTVVYRAYE